MFFADKGWECISIIISLLKPYYWFIIMQMKMIILSFFFIRIQFSYILYEIIIITSIVFHNLHDAMPK